MAKRSCLVVRMACRAGWLLAAVQATIALSCLAPVTAVARVDLAGNARGDQVLLHQLLEHQDRPLSAGTRAPSARFGPLAPVSLATAVSERAAVVDDAGGAVIAWATHLPDTYPPDSPAYVATRAPGRDFAAPLEIGQDAGRPLLASNARGDALVAFGAYGKEAQYRFRAAGGEFGPPTAAPLPLLIGIALDEDGTALFAGVQFDHETGSDRLLVVTQPHGAAPGAAKEVPGGTSVFDVHMTSAPNGRTLIVWRDSNGVVAVERPPGGDFSPRYTVATGAVASQNPIAYVKLASSGAAAVLIGTYGGFLTVRDPAGQFRPLIPVPSREPASVAVGERGDAAAVWHGTDGNGVRGMYRAAGASRWSAPRVLGPTRQFAPYTALPPAVAVDGSGRASVAWEESDGATVRTYTRDFRGSSADPQALVDSTPTYFSEAPPRACRPAGARVLRASRRARIFDQDNELFGCLFDRGVPVFLGDDTSLHDAFPASTMTLAGPLVASGYNYLDRVDQGSQMIVMDLRDGEFGINRTAWLDGYDYATLVGTRLRPNGAVAWMSCVDPSEVGANAKACRRVEGDSKHVWVWGSRSVDPRLVDRGRNIDPRSFRLRGSKLTWRHGNKLRHARLR
jgi:hypothetical protein